MMVGEFLSHDQCWDEWTKHLHDENEYHQFESGERFTTPTAQQEWAFHHQEMNYGLCSTSVDEAFELMEAAQVEQERRLLCRYADTGDTPELIELYYSYHHQPQTAPYWQVCVKKIEEALNDQH